MANCNQEGNKEYDQQRSLEENRQSEDTRKWLLIGNKWVFEIKRDGTYRARLVALGYSQIPGVDYTDNFAPVAHDVSFRIALARMMVENWTAW